MQKDHRAKKNLRSNMKQEFSETNAKKVKQEIRKDIEKGQGVMTSREAGSMRD